LRIEFLKNEKRKSIFSPSGNVLDRKLKMGMQLGWQMEHNGHELTIFGSEAMTFSLVIVHMYSLIGGLGRSSTRLLSCIAW
jgi:hypothetical protein